MGACRVTELGSLLRRRDFLVRTGLVVGAILVIMFALTFVAAYVYTR